MKEKILKLRLEGKTYNQIKNILGCSKSTISFHCGEGQKEKNRLRGKKYKSENYLIKKVDAWHRNKFILATRNFKVPYNIKKDNIDYFNYKEVLKKFGMNTFCYMTGEKINLLKDNKYQFDHIIPISRGGKSDIENLGILHKTVNRMKHNLNNDEFLYWCIKILKYNGYNIKKKEYNYKFKAL